MSQEHSFPVPAEPRLVVSDMDGTLLHEDGSVPEAMWPLFEQMAERGILFAAASGRQHGSLARLFETRAQGVVYIADNGCLVVEGGEAISTTTLDLTSARHLVRVSRDLARNHQIGVVWSGNEGAYVDQGDQRTYNGSLNYYAVIEMIDDLLELDVPPLKLAFYAEGGFSDEAVQTIVANSGDNRALVSGLNWVDVQNPVADKAVGVRDLQRRHGIRPDQTIVFGDYLNDLGMLKTTPYSYAMANAHPDVLKAARYVAPSSAESGVVQVLRQLIG